MVWFYFNEVTRIGKFRETKYKRGPQGLGVGDSEWGILFNGYKASVWDDENILEIEMYNIVNLLKIVHFEMVKMINFVLCRLGHNKNNYQQNLEEFDT